MDLQRVKDIVMRIPAVLVRFVGLKVLPAIGVIPNDRDQRDTYLN